MKFNLFLLSAAAMVNAASSADHGAVSDPITSPTGVGLGTAGEYAILSKAGISTTSTPTFITGSIGVSPIAATAITGFSLIADSTNTLSSSTLVSGKVKAADFTSPTCTELTTAISNMETAYTDAASRHPTSAATTNVLGGSIGGSTLTPGVYKFDSSVSINADIYLKGGPTDIFIIQMTGDLIQAAGTSVILEDNDGTLSTDSDAAAQYTGPKPENIFWQVAGLVNVGTTAKMKGVLLVKTKAVFNFGSTLNGRILAQTAVTLDDNDITQPPL